MKTSACAFIFLFYAIYSGCKCDTETDDGVVVKVAQGRIRGKIVKTPTGKDVEAFLGVPYAQPPLGRLRFKPPVALESWDDVLNTTSLPDSCMQRDLPFLRRVPVLMRWLPTTPISEDCLKLNIWVPRTRSQNLEVLVFIHGGKFFTGSTSAPVYSGSILASEENIIVVTLNYRMNSFGFLYLDHPDVPGNVGLRDQTMALRWLSENIEIFGGDKDKVTVFGQSAGAVSIGYHLVSPESKNLFQRVIIQSGGPTSDWSIQDKFHNKALSLQLADNLQCPHNISNLIECLHQADATDILHSEPVDGTEFSVFRPIVDGSLLPENPKILYKKKSFSVKEVMIGVTKEEGTLFLTVMMPGVFPVLRNDSRPNHEHVMTVARILFPGVPEFVYKAIELFYTNWLNPDDHKFNVYAASSILGDVNFVCSVNEVAQAFAENGIAVYKYLYAHHSTVGLPKWMGAVHGDDLKYVFGEPLNVEAGYTEEEANFSRRVMRYWANFARTGDPNQGERTDVQWPRYTSKAKEYLVLAPSTAAVGSKYRDRVCTFWDEVFPHISNVTVHW